MAADKYIVYHLCDSLLKCIEENLDPANFCLIYDQLIKIQKVKDVKSTLNYVKNLIGQCGQEAFKNKYFTQIDQDTLIDLLKMENLDISEIDALKACAKWVDAEISRQS